MAFFYYTKQHIALFVFTILYIVGFAVYYISTSDFEFLWYVLVLVGFAGLITATLKHSRLPLWLLWLLSVWGLLHMAGGGVVIDDHVLYAQMLIPLVGGEYDILKYDQVVHAYGFGVTALLAYLLLSRVTTMRPFWLSAAAVLVSTGLGALNEIVEFIAVVLVPDTGVGGYVNTALDLVFNALGAILAVIMLYIVRRFRT